MLNRREWLRLTGAGAAGALTGGLLSTDLLAWGREVHAAVAAQGAVADLDADAMRLLSITCERVIPTDDTPGAVAAGVPRFIDHMLANWYDPPERGRVVSGLKDLDKDAQARFAHTFVDCTEAQQDTLLLELDAQGAKTWFGTVKYLTIWGYYTSEVGVKQELQQWPLPGRYDGCAPYSPRPRTTSQGASVAGPDQRRAHGAG